MKINNKLKKKVTGVNKLDSISVASNVIVKFYDRGIVFRTHPDKTPDNL